MTPDVSVVIPAYDSSATIGRAIRSIAAQTVDVREIIVVDDGSQDGTPRLVEETFPQVRIIRQANAGAAAARNAGARAASGQWLGFVDADDEWAPTKLARQLDVLDAQPAIGMLGCLVAFERDGVVVPERPADAHRQVGEMRYADLLRGDGGYFISASYLVRRETLLSAGGFEESLRSGHDTELFLRLLYLGHTLRVLHEPLYIWHFGEDSLSGGGVSPKRARNIVRAMRAQPHPRDAANGVSLVSDAEYRRALAIALENAALACGNRGDFEGARELFEDLAAEPRLAWRIRLRALLATRLVAPYFWGRGAFRSLARASRRMGAG
jgi:glycosyltransferase involved in cell wall biosynthesis